MLAYGLYAQDFVHEAHATLKEVSQICNDTEKAKVFPGIPSYFNNEDRGVYAYLTGSSSWYLLTLTTQVFGLRGEHGKLCIQPKLTSEQFDKNGIAEISFNFKGYRFNLTYKNLKTLDYNQYKIKNIEINSKKVNIEENKGKILIDINDFKLLNTENEIIVELTIR